MSKKLLNINVLIFLLCFNSCVSEDEHQKLIDQKNNLEIENKQLKAELDDMKFGATNLISDGKKFYLAKDYTNAKTKFQLLVEKHPDMPESIEANKYLRIIDEEELYQNILDNNDTTLVQNYMQKYPNGRFLDKVRMRRVEMLKKFMSDAYNNASKSNTSYQWKKFLDDYPNFNEAAQIREKIIRLEVDEIMGSESTGQMPSFDNYGSGYSTTSTVSITNNTSCTLDVRYSGPDAKIITIASGSTRTIYLNSGEYRIAASACGANYGGAQSLHGSYTSSFYIQTRRF